MTRLTVSVQQRLAAPVEDIWAVIDDTARYAEWVDGVLEVTAHHGTATVGETYSEHNRTLGPLTTRSVWTVGTIEPHSLRVDSGTGFAPLHDMVNTFRFEPIGTAATLMTYRVDCRVGLGPLGHLLAPVLRSSLSGQFRRSMARLEDVVLAERGIDQAGG
ncbi:SRPBCC family protein [Dietzia sp. SYD-A1]|uniref:SRPBCC family protein n=1 Tax=Dietzia sp. SYD-A1 TaxID=2780141 RepID=UPI001891EF22|nr:SRPBCC family protein [Dietzia sp. SYD-A1]